MEGIVIGNSGMDYGRDCDRKFLVWIWKEL